jgi:hypothetical protein
VGAGALGWVRAVQVSPSCRERDRYDRGRTAHSGVLRSVARLRSVGRSGQPGRPLTLDWASVVIQPSHVTTI